MSHMKEEIENSIDNVKADYYCDECDLQFCNHNALQDHNKLLHHAITNENPWNIESLYDLQYFNCPSCTYKNNLKQEFIDHAYHFHPESSWYLNNISDGSMTDVEIPNETKEPLDFKYDLENDYVNGSLDIKEEEFYDDITNNSNQSPENDTINYDSDSEEIVKNNHKCNSCGKSFSHAGNLKTHINSVHNGQKYHKCESCGKAFSKADT